MYINKRLEKVHLNKIKIIADNLNIKIPQGSSKLDILALLSSSEYLEVVLRELDRIKLLSGKVKEDNLVEFLKELKLVHLKYIADHINVQIPEVSNNRKDIINLLYNYRKSVVKEINKNRYLYDELKI